MTNARITPTDICLRDAVARQLAWDPRVDARAIGVAAKDGVIALTGFIDSYLRDESWVTRTGDPRVLEGAGRRSTLW